MHVVLDGGKILVCLPGHLVGVIVAVVGGGIVYKGHRVAVLLAVVLFVLYVYLVSGVDDVG